MSNVERYIDVNVPLQTAYNQWTQFEQFPEFMDNVEKIRQEGPTTLYWHVNILGIDKEWEARITEQLPDKRIAWTNMNGATNGGGVTFHYLDDNSTRVTLQMGYEPDNVIEQIGDMLGFVENQVASDLRNFKEFIESNGHATGAWRGTIQNGQVIEPEGELQS
jgi:uncharacterized membrane protein